MIDPTTLPVSMGETVVPAGTTYEVKGRNFNMWPANVVLSFTEQYAINENLPSVFLLREVSRTNTSMVFRVDVSSDFSSDRYWRYFASPDVVPRAILQYELM